MSSLSQRHRQVLAVCLADLHRRLGTLETVLAEAERGEAASEYVDDLTPEQKRQARQRLAELRGALFEVARRHDVPLQLQRRSLRQTLLAELSLLRVAVDDLGARRLKSYGPLNTDAVDELERMQFELQRRLERLVAELRPDGPEA